MLYHTLNFFSYTHRLLRYVMKLSFSYNALIDLPFKNVQNFFHISKDCSWGNVGCCLMKFKVFWKKRRKKIKENEQNKLWMLTTVPQFIIFFLILQMQAQTFVGKVSLLQPHTYVYIYTPYINKLIILLFRSKQSQWVWGPNTFHKLLHL